jgi:type III secretory pathway component EscV
VKIFTDEFANEINELVDNTTRARGIVLNSLVGEVEFRLVNMGLDLNDMRIILSKLLQNLEKEKNDEDMGNLYEF